LRSTTSPFALAVAVLMLALAAGPARAQQEQPAPSALQAPTSAAPGALTIPGQPAPGTQPLTLAEAVRRALERNRAIGSARAEVNVAQAQVEGIFSAILPKVSLLGDYTRNSKEAAFGSGNDRRVILPADDWSYRLALSQPIYAGNRERRALQQARLGVESARLGVADTADQVLVGVVSDYLGVIEGEALLAVERRNLELAEGRRRQAQDLFEAGETTRVEPLRAESDVKAAERRLAVAEQGRQNALSRLRLGLALDDPAGSEGRDGGAAAIGGLAVANPGPFFPPLPPADVLLREAAAGRPEVRQAETALEVARLEVAKQRGALLPVVTADGGYLKQRSSFPSDMYGFLSLNVNVPLYQGGEVKARVAVARERQQQAELRLAEVRQAVREEVRQALVGRATAERSLALAREQLAAAEAEHAQATELYRAQETTALDLEAAETSLTLASRAVALGETDLALAELSVWAAAGLLQSSILPEGSR
jgi:outer membrane protein